MPKWLKILATVILAVLACLALYNLFAPPPDLASKDKDVSLAMKWARAGEAKDAGALKKLAHKDRQEIVDIYLADRVRFADFKFEGRTIGDKSMSTLPSGASSTRVGLKEFYSFKERKFGVDLYVYLSPYDAEGSKIVGARYASMGGGRGGSGRGNFSESCDDDEAMAACNDWLKHLEQEDMAYCAKAYVDPIRMGVSDYESLPKNAPGENMLWAKTKIDSGNLKMIGVMKAGNMSGLERMSVLYAELKDRTWRTISVGLLRDTYWGGENNSWFPSRPWIDNKWQDWNPEWNTEDDCIRGIQAQFTPKKK